MSNFRDPFAGDPPAPQPGPAAPATPVAGQLAPPIVRYALAVLAGAGLALAVLFAGTLAGRWDQPGGEAAAARLATVGRAYRLELGKVYADAWLAGARRLDDGQGPAAALEAVAKAWDAGRVALFERQVTPELARVVPEGKADAELSPGDRARLAAAWRGFARGLRGDR